jgi:hypothetical protein
MGSWFDWPLGRIRLFAAGVGAVESEQAERVRAASETTSRAKGRRDMGAASEE